MDGKKCLIGLTCNYDYRDDVGLVSHMGLKGQDWNFVSGDYVYFVEKAGAVPVLIPQMGRLESIYPLLDALDGVIVTGGHDVGPENYGAFPKPWCGEVMHSRDRQDIEVVRYMTFERGRPVLGICRGIQIMNAAFGGTLYQDLEKEGDFEHHFGDRYPRNAAWQKMSFEPGSKLENIYGACEIFVNSFHHQAVRDPGKDVRITGHSPDGVPEAIELEGHDFTIGVQWHPEMMFDSSQQYRLIEAMVAACARS